MRINAKVLAALTAVALVLYLVVPDLFAEVLPLLILAACPLSMFLMMRMMSGGKKEEREPGSNHIASSPIQKEEGG
ncbi:MAG: DUF2933 domain-containing protein [Actinomycetota bacterium]|jgi:hypothetical protein|nr:DUF2933 domain-containing protein [Actinomycetota bacterium]